METVKYNYLSNKRLNDILNKCDNQRIGIIGDSTLDIYWPVDMTKSELSRETPHYPYPVIDERIDLGAGGNVAVNLAVLSEAEIYLLTVIGKDWRGVEFKKVCKQKKINTEYIIETEERITPAYCKPLIKGYSEIIYEAPRLDFINCDNITKQLEINIKEKIDNLINNTDILIISDQLEYGIINNAIREKINTLGKQKTIIVDSRQNIEKFTNVITKPNKMEAINAIDTNYSWEKAGKLLSKKSKAPVLMTLGEGGSCWIEENGKIIRVPAVKTGNNKDIVGAGDSFLSAFTIAYSAGANIKEAMLIGNLAASVVIQKLRETGTASKQEIITAFNSIMEAGLDGDN
ncbi:MAG: bifunctional heptose 7-phosphate kinase/heptose 1-phosphate adenyltransferase [Bacillota bacterium]